VVETPDGQRRAIYIWHPVLVHVGISGSDLATIWKDFENALAGDQKEIGKALARDWQAIGSELQWP
jgi:hypothetical protein